MHYDTQQEVRMRKNPERIPGAVPDDVVRVIPSDVQLERAHQNRKLAEIRYDLAVRKGQAWSVSEKPPVKRTG